MPFQERMNPITAALSGRSGIAAHGYAIRHQEYLEYAQATHFAGLRNQPQRILLSGYG